MSRRLNLKESKLTVNKNYSDLIIRSEQCRIAARAECAIAQGPDLLGGPGGPPNQCIFT